MWPIGIFIRPVLRCGCMETNQNQTNIIDTKNMFYNNVLDVASPDLQLAI